MAVNELVATVAAVSNVTASNARVTDRLRWARFDDDVQFRVDVAFQDNPLSVTPLWFSVSTDVRRFHISRGRSNEISNVRPGALTVLLDNLAGDYDPDYTGSPWYNVTHNPQSSIQPMKQIRVQALHSGTTYDLYRGFAERWPQRFDFLHDKTVDLQAVDGLKFINLARSTSTFAQETHNVRIGNLLDDASWPTSWRNLSTTTREAQTYSADSQSALGLIRQVEKSNGGAFYMANNGDATYRVGGYRASLLSLSSLRFDWDFRGTAAGKFQRLDVSWDDEQIWNTVTVSNVSDASTFANPTFSNNVPSITQYGNRQLEISDSINQRPTDDASLGLTLINAFKIPTHVTTLVTNPRADTGNWGGILNFELDDETFVNRPLTSGTPDVGEAFIDSLVIDVNVDTKRWVVTMTGSENLFP